MTPRINNPSHEQDLGKVFSETLIREMKEKKQEHNLKSRAPIFDLLHPKLIDAKLRYLNNPEQEPLPVEVPGWYIYPFSVLSEAPAHYPQIYGQPYEIGKILKHDIQEVVIDFYPIGAVLLSRQPKDIALAKGLHQHLIPIWMSYALSPDLWGPQGKWTRFHERLHQLFTKHNLLKGEDYPGFYPLDLKARRLEEFGFNGTVLEDTFTITLPWTFPLTALHHLEKVISQEF